MNFKFNREGKREGKREEGKREGEEGKREDGREGMIFCPRERGRLDFLHKGKGKGN